MSWMSFGFSRVRNNQARISTKNKVGGKSEKIQQIIISPIHFANRFLFQR